MSQGRTSGASYSRPPLSLTGALGAQVPLCQLSGDPMLQPTWTPQQHPAKVLRPLLHGSWLGQESSPSPHTVLIKLFSHRGPHHVQEAC